MIKEDQVITKSYNPQKNKDKIKIVKFTKWLSKVR
jgi:hypothetical protein